MVNNAEVAVQRKQKKNSLPFKICIFVCVFFFCIFYGVFDVVEVAAGYSSHDAG